MAYGDFITKVGETVGVVRQHSRDGTILNSRFGTVTKINGHGHIFVQSDDQELRFTRRGDAYKNNWGPSLMNADKLRSYLEADARRKEQVRVARAMEQELKEGYAYSGRFFPTQERIAQLKMLLVEMETLVDNT
jgi:flagellar hook protein FlgE